MNTDDARPSLEAAIQRIAQRKEPEIRLVLGEALRHAGYQLTENGYHADALVLYDALIAWLGESDDPSLQTVVAQARVNRANVLETVEEPDVAIAALEGIAAEYGESADPNLQEAAARSIRGKAAILLSQGRNLEALAAEREVVERFGDSEHEDTLDQVGRALNEAAHTALSLLNLPDKGDELLAKSIELFGNWAGSPLRAHAINARYNRGVIRAESGDPESAFREWDHALAILQDEPDTNVPEIQAAIARVLVAKGLALKQMGEIDEARRQYETVLSFCDRTDDPEVATEVCNAANNLTSDALELDGDVEACVPVLEAAIARALVHDDDETSDAVAHALLMKAFVQWKLGRHEDAIATYDGIVALFQPALAVAAKVAEAMFNKGSRLQEMRRLGDAEATFDRLIEEFSDVDDTVVQDFVLAAEENRAEVKAEIDTSA